ncbi:hypothetical protein EDM53_03350 [Rickettsiales endosymbiont of Peranema trichophorum]|uniref:hypothetical protein n=1 Tax=Rickettsiales endosymbiont of Peranema trichophorum TaxID=2486577 RepID=UPI001023A9A4|nr:hypothetical protein [Rickettsiales endosymbiont of Peranema trichophorum]RZI47168.1 hypothetical protein EDM53_03350 [Rickettsiales endosymbiont of Peranema trichophorum]
MQGVETSSKSIHATNTSLPIPKEMLYSRKIVFRLQMKSFKRYIFCAFLVLQLSACGSRQYVEQHTDINGFNNGRKGIVLMQNTASMSTLRTTWRHNKSGKYFTAHRQGTNANVFFGIMTLGALIDFFHHDTMIYFIEPGSYSLSDISFQDKYCNNISNVIDFEVVGGEVYYLGKMMINDDFVTVVNTIDIRDDYDSALKSFQERYPQINKVPKKRLMMFTERAIAIKAISRNFGIME